MAAYLEASMMFDDLEEDQEKNRLADSSKSEQTRKERTTVKFDETHLKVQEHESIFEDIIQELEHEDEDSFQKPQRRGSLKSVSTESSISVADLIKEPTSLSTRKKPRRHSTFHSSDRRFHRKKHQEMKEHFLDSANHKRSSIIDGLFQFQLSVNMSMASMDHFEDNTSPSLYRSCPVLSYMNDDDEDSVELYRIKRPSLSLIKDVGEYMDEDNDYELSDDEDFELNESTLSKKKTTFKVEERPKQIIKRAYTVKLAGTEDDGEKPRAKKRTTSYAMLSMRLDDHPLTVLDDIRSASMSNLQTEEPRKGFMPDTPSPRKPPSSKRLQQFKMSHDEGSFGFDNNDLLSGSALPPSDMPLDHPCGVGRAA